MKVKVHTLNSFVKTGNGGNPAGVVLDGDGLSGNEMKQIAARVGFSETAFIQKSGCADYRVRFFTPASEVDLCGHATIAAFYLLLFEGIISPGVYRQETGSGILQVEAGSSGKIFMGQTLPEFCGKIDGSEVADCLGINCSGLLEGFPVEIVSTGLKDIFVPVASLEKLLSLKPDLPGIAGVSKKYGVVGIHAFSPETMYGSTAHCRNFAPLYGIPEESATGTSNGALGCYLFKYGKIPGGGEKNMVFEQGYCMARPSEVLVRLDVCGDEITGVQVGGTAEITGEIDIRI